MTKKPKETIGTLRKEVETYRKGNIELGNVIVRQHDNYKMSLILTAVIVASVISLLIGGWINVDPQGAVNFWAAPQKFVLVPANVFLSPAYNVFITNALANTVNIKMNTSNTTNITIQAFDQGYILILNGTGMSSSWYTKYTDCIVTHGYFLDPQGNKGNVSRDYVISFLDVHGQSECSDLTVSKNYS